MIAKASDPEALTALAAKLAPGVALLPLIESAAGLAAARALAAVSGVAQLAFGSIDLALDLGCEETFEALIAARSEVVLASRLAGLASPLDGVTAGYNDAGLLTAEARRARSLGFGGKLLIHPRQIAPALAGFRPSEAEIAWAREILEAVGRKGEGAIAVGGRMIDAPVIATARRLLAYAG
jgi:citrate lyase subunit beta/citryl-CoA lyase